MSLSKIMIGSNIKALGICMRRLIPDTVCGAFVVSFPSRSLSSTTKAVELSYGTSISIESFWDNEIEHTRSS